MSVQLRTPAKQIALLPLRDVQLRRRVGYRQAARRDDLGAQPRAGVDRETGMKLDRQRFVIAKPRQTVSNLCRPPIIQI